MSPDGEKKEPPEERGPGASSQAERTTSGEPESTLRSQAPAEAQVAEGGAADDEADAIEGDAAEGAGPARDLVHGCPVVDSLGATVVLADRERYLPLMEGLKADGFDMPVGVLGVDYLTHPGRDLPAGVTPERFEVVVELVSIAHNRRIRVRCQVPEADAAVPTLFDLWPGTEAHEREVYDMYGIRFDGHPDMTRILMPEDWEGHPLRKDYATGHVAVQFKEAPGAG